MDSKNNHFSRLTVAWLALVALTLASLGLSEWFREVRWLPLLVAVIIWLKGVVVARCFIESAVAHPFIARVLKVFIAVSPLALIATAFFGGTLARWATL
ncbi:hypothetical protein [Dechloromonas sp.]|uniref:hypothetical protein n=1 Tax=Dechloromonas sp. TaxID=1917218 RepID=UPI00286D995D|nr:hypothetical protein [Dechloromonas sp.]